MTSFLYVFDEKDDEKYIGLLLRPSVKKNDPGFWPLESNFRNKKHKRPRNKPEYNTNLNSEREK